MVTNVGRPGVHRGSNRVQRANHLLQVAYTPILGVSDRNSESRGYQECYLWSARQKSTVTFRPGKLLPSVILASCSSTMAATSAKPKPLPGCLLTDVHAIESVKCLSPFGFGNAYAGIRNNENGPRWAVPPQSQTKSSRCSKPTQWAGAHEG